MIMALSREQVAASTAKKLAAAAASLSQTKAMIGRVHAVQNDRSVRK
jgi:hypothetical protein